MLFFNKIIVLSKQLAASLLKDERPAAIENFEIFKEVDKNYILKNLTEDSLIKERLSLTNQINTQADWEKIRSKIVVPVRRRRLYWHYMAAAVVMGILVAGYFFREIAMDPPEDTNLRTVNNIETGTDKATLTLEDGSEVALERDVAYQTTYANSDGEQIVYEAKNEGNAEIANNYLTIPRGGQFIIVLSDGTRVWLNSESRLKYPISFRKGKPREVVLVYGEAYFEVSPSTEHGGSKFKVLHKFQEVEVLGTEFNIKAYKNEANIYTTLVEGKVAINTVAARHVLAPKQQSNLSLKDKSIHITDVDVYSETSWRKGLFVFKGMPLKEIMIVLSRWYDVDIKIVDAELENVKFNGVLNKNQNLEDILTTIKNSFMDTYEIKNNKIIILK